MASATIGLNKFSNFRESVYFWTVVIKICLVCNENLLFFKNNSVRYLWSNTFKVSICWSIAAKPLEFHPNLLCVHDTLTDLHSVYYTRMYNNMCTYHLRTVKGFSDVVMLTEFKLSTEKVLCILHIIHGYPYK